MKNPAGGQRIKSAQFRELQAFAQFGSDLDKATQDSLTRGEKLVELLKQGQYVPVKVEDQVMIIYAGTSGGLDGLATARVMEFEREFLQYMRDAKPEIGKGILDTGKLSDDGKAMLDESIAAVIRQMGADTPLVKA
jgi:F-type H+-transporting ATPase subunit alpha